MNESMNYSHLKVLLTFILDSEFFFLKFPKYFYMYNVINIIQCQCIIYYDVLPDTYGHLLGLMFNAQYQYTLITAVLEFAKYY